MSGFRDIILAIMAGRQKEQALEAQRPYMEQQARALQLANNDLERQQTDTIALRDLLRNPPMMTATTFAPADSAVPQSSLSSKPISDDFTGGQKPQYSLAGIQPQQRYSLSGGPGTGMPEGFQADPSLTDITGRRTEQQTPERATFDFLRQRDPLKAQTFASSVLNQAKSIATAGDHPGAIDYVNNALGTNMTYLGSKDNIMTIANGDGTHSLYDITTGKSQQIGTPKPVTVSEGTSLVNPSTGKAIFQAAPKPVSVAEGGALVDPKTGETVYESPTTKFKGFDTVDLGDRVKIVPRDGSAPYIEKKAATPNAVIKIQQGTQNHTINGLSDPEYDALYGPQGAVTEGRLDPYKINSRTGKIYAQGELRNPGQNWNQTAANTGMERNPVFQRQRVNLEAVKQPVEDLVTLSDNLNKGSIVPFNAATNWLKLKTGDPDVVAFNAKRNSVMQELANAMRGQGISDAGIKLEMDNFNNAYSPQQIRAAVQNTLDVINAKLGALDNQPYPTATTGRRTGQPAPQQRGGGYSLKKGGTSISSFWNND